MWWHNDGMSMQQGEWVPDLTLGWRLRMSLGDTSVQEMADALGVARESISRWTSDRTKPKRGTLMAWSLKTGVSLQWLETGIAPQPELEGDLVRQQGLEPRTRWYEAKVLDLRVCPAA